MNYPSLTTLNTISVLIFIGVGVFIFNLIMKKWIGVGWKKSFKIMGGYLLASILIYFIYPYPILADFFVFNLSVNIRSTGMDLLYWF